MAAAPYDVPEAISVLGNLLLSQAGQEGLLRLLGERKVTLPDLKRVWAEREKAQPPFIAEEQ